MLSQEESMLTATDPMDMTPEKRRSEIAAILAAGFTITVAGSVPHHRPACPAKPAAGT